MNTSSFDRDFYSTEYIFIKLSDIQRSPWLKTHADMLYIVDADYQSFQMRISKFHKSLNVKFITIIQCYSRLIT